MRRERPVSHWPPGSKPIASCYPRPTASALPLLTSRPELLGSHRPGTHGVQPVTSVHGTHCGSLSGEWLPVAHSIPSARVIHFSAVCAFFVRVKSVKPLVPARVARGTPSFNRVHETAPSTVDTVRAYRPDASPK